MINCKHCDVDATQISIEDFNNVDSYSADYV
jgi:hypothetical protein